LTKNIRLEQNPGDNAAREFAKWILKIGDGELCDIEGESLIEIPSDLIIHVDTHPINDIINATYPKIQAKYTDAKYLEERAILAPTNDFVQDINDFMINLINVDEETYLSVDSICKVASSIPEQDAMYPIEFLNSLKFLGIPNHRLRLKVGLPKILLRNLNQSAGLCNGTRLLVTQLSKWVLEAQIISGTHVGDKVFIPRIVLSPSESNWPFVLKRRQFSVSICFAMKINKSQGQLLKRVGLFLHKPVFCHGQLYVAVSRVTSRNGLRVLIAEKDYNDHFHTKNIVYKEIFGNLPRGNYCHLLYVIKSTLQLRLY
jgi:ATP-dependent DNA helicase PIF1